MSELYDKNGREILIGDVLKVFHFIGSRRKRHYMYKHVVGMDRLGKSNRPHLRINHLNLSDNTNYEPMDGRHLTDYEIVQGYGEDGKPFDDRPKKSPVNRTVGR